jgi:membrane fusion protein, multidrug efflux system
VRYISSTADEMTRTFRVELEIPNPSRRLVHGVSSEMHLPLPPVSAHLVSPAILTLADDGTLGVKLVNDQGIVEFHPATIIGDGPQGVWLGGLPKSATFITVGQEFVVAGQKVEPVPEEPVPAS